MTDRAQGSRDRGPTRSRAAAFAGYLGALGGTAGRPALARVLPLYLGAAAPAAVIFGPNGMHPADLADAAAWSWGVRAALWSGWILAALPAARALFDAEHGIYLRWLPAPRWWSWAGVACMLVGIQALWGLFWWAGRGPLAAVAGVALAAAVQGIALISPRHRREAMARRAGLATAAGLVIAGARSEILLAAGMAGLVVAVPAAWARSPEHGRRTARAPRGNRPAWLLARLYLRGLWRTRPGLVTRSLLTTALGAGLVVLAAGSNQMDLATRAELSVMVAAVSLSLGLGGAAAALVEAEGAVRWILVSVGTRPQVRVRARSLAAGAAGVALGALHGALASWGTGALGLGRMAGAAALLGLGLGIAAASAAAWAEVAARERAAGRRGPREPLDDDAGRPRQDVGGARVLAGVIGCMIAALVLLSALGEAAVLLVACAGVILAGARR